MHILFITSNRIGDAILSTGVLAGLMERYPDAVFWVACGPLAVPIFEHAPRVERVIALRKAPWAGHWRMLLRETFARRWEVVVDLRSSATAYLLRTKKRHVLKANHTLHRVVHNAGVANFVPPPWPRVWPGEAARNRARDIVPEERKVLAVGPSTNWHRKMWPVDRYAALVRRLLAPGGPMEDAHLLILAGPGERDLCGPLFTATPPERQSALIGEDLGLVAACFERVRLYIGGDSGLMHMAAAAGAPTLGLFGPTPDGRYDPWGKHTASVRGRSQAEILAETGTDLDGPNAMQDLTVDKVFEAAATLLSSSESDFSGKDIQ